MKYSYLFCFFAFLGTCIGLNAQITVTNAGFPVLNDTVFYAFDTNSNPVHMLTPPGGNQNWNLSGLQVSQTGFTVYRNPNVGAQSANFPGAELLVIEGGRELYYNVTDNEVELIGYFGSDPLNLGANLVISYSPPFAERRAPINFFDIHVESGGILKPFHPNELPANILQQLVSGLGGNTPDSLRIRVAKTRIDVVNAWGILSIPGGCYEVLREDRTTYTESRLDAKIPPLGWLDVTDNVRQIPGLVYGVDTTKKFHFFSMLDKQEIAVLHINNDQNAIVSVRFKHPDNSQFSISNITTTPESCPNANDGSIAITTAGGAGTLHYSISGPHIQSNSTGIFTALPDGMYNIIVTSSNSPCFQEATTSVASGTDIVPPAANCVNAELSFNGQQSIVLNSNELVNATDNCGIQNISLIPAEIFASQAGQTIPVTVTVTDNNGNTATCISQITTSGLPSGWNQNINGVGCSDGNSIEYNAASEVWTATSTNCYYGSPFTSDATAFAQRTLCGNGSITAQVTGINGTSPGWAGVVMRESNAAGAKKAQLTTNMAGNQSRREFRTSTNGAAIPQNFPAQNRFWLRIVRSGNQFALYNSPNGTQWYIVGAQTITMGNCIEMGLVGTNYTSNSTVTATFANVSFTGNGPLPASPLPENGFNAAVEQYKPDFSVYPNPTSGELNINLKEYIGKNVQVELYSLEGRLIQMIQVDEILQNIQTLKLDRYAGGMYFVKLKSAGLPDVTKRVVLVK